MKNIIDNKQEVVIYGQEVRPLLWVRLCPVSYVCYIGWMLVADASYFVSTSILF